MNNTPNLSFPPPTGLGSAAPQAQIMTVTPAMAAEWLTRNIHNRKISDYAVAQYAADMAEGRWHMTGEAIQFDVHGVLRKMGSID